MIVVPLTSDLVFVSEGTTPNIIIIPQLLLDSLMQIQMKYGRDEAFKIVGDRIDHYLEDVYPIGPSDEEGFTERVRFTVKFSTSVRHMASTLYDKAVVEIAEKDVKRYRELLAEITAQQTRKDVASVSTN